MRVLACYFKICELFIALWYNLSINIKKSLKIKNKASE